MGSRKFVNASRNSAHYALAGSGVVGFKVIGDSPDAKECHLRLNRAPKRSEVIEHRAGRYIADRVRLENIATVPEELRYMNPRCKLAEIAARLLNTLAAHVNQTA